MDNMNNPEEIPTLYKIRDTGAALGDTFIYIKQNFKQIFVPLVLVVWPIRVLFNYFTVIRTRGVAQSSQMGYTHSTTTSILIVYLYAFLMYVVTLVAGVIVIGYIKQKEDKKAAPALGQTLKEFGTKVPKVLIAVIISSLLSILGALLLILPGIYLFVTFSILLPVVVIEKGDIFKAIGRCFDLMKNRFWSTLWYMIVMAFVLSAVFTLTYVPTYVLFIAKALSGADSRSAFDGTDSPIYFINVVIVNLIFTLFYGVYIIAITIWYYSLAEEKSGVDALRRLDQIHSLTVNANEGDF